MTNESEQSGGEPTADPQTPEAEKADAIPDNRPRREREMKGPKHVREKCAQLLHGHLPEETMEGLYAFFNDALGGELRPVIEKAAVTIAAEQQGYSYHPFATYHNNCSFLTNYLYSAGQGISGFPLAHRITAEFLEKSGFTPNHPDYTALARYCEDALRQDSKRFGKLLAGEMTGINPDASYAIDETSQDKTAETPAAAQKTTLRPLSEYSLDQLKFLFLRGPKGVILNKGLATGLGLLKSIADSPEIREDILDTTRLHMRKLMAAYLDKAEGEPPQTERDRLVDARLMEQAEAGDSSQVRLKEALAKDEVNKAAERLIELMIEKKLKTLQQARA